MTPLGFVIVSLATYGLSDMVVRKDGPLGIFHRLRTLLGATQEACETQRENGRITSALCCIECTAFWMAAICVVLWVYAPAGAWVLASVGVTMLLNRLI